MKALVEMLKAFELATRMLQKGRIRTCFTGAGLLPHSFLTSQSIGHFLGALLSKSDDFQKALGTLEDVTSDEERMAIAELVTGIHHLSSEIQDGASFSSIIHTPSCEICLVSASVARLVENIRDVRPLSGHMATTTQTILSETRGIHRQSMFRSLHA